MNHSDQFDSLQRSDSKEQFVQFHIILMILLSNILTVSNLAPMSNKLTLL